MKKIFKISILGLFAFVFLISSFVFDLKRTVADETQTIIPFRTAETGSEISNVDVCCNGLEFTITYGSSIDEDAGTAAQNAKAAGTYIFPWLPNMIPNPETGMGFYQWWSIQELSSVLGNKTAGGVCVTVKSECESSEAVTYTVLSTGTNLLNVPAQAI